MSKAIRSVLFLCTGNYYRSRYAEELFNHYAQALELPWRAFSRGAAERGSPGNVGPISHHALAALVAKRVRVAGVKRSPQPCLTEDLEGADLVIALKEAEHRPLIERRFPGFTERITYWHVDDIELMHPTKALARIDELIHGLIRTLASLI